MDGCHISSRYTLYLFLLFLVLQDRYRIVLIHFSFAPLNLFIGDCGLIII